MPLRLATYNLENFDRDDRRPPPFSDRLKALRPMLAALDADVLCLQEINAQKTDDHGRDFAALDELVAGTPYAAFHRAWSLKPGGERPADIHNLVILSRFPVMDQRSIRHDYITPSEWRPLHGDADAPPMPLTWDRPMLYAKLALPDGRALHVVDLHLRAPRAAYIPGAKQGGVWQSSAAWAEGYLLAGQKRGGQALEARLFVEHLFTAEPDALIAVCGDLNADAHEMPTRILQALPEDMGTDAFASRALSPLDRRVPAEQRFTILHGGRKILFDHILASPRLAALCRRVDICNAGLADEALTAGPVAGSLHAPLLAVFDDERPPASTTID